MEEYLTTAVLHKRPILMQIEKITEKYYLFMAVGIPTTDTTLHMKYSRLLSNIFYIVGGPIITLYKCITRLKKLISSPLT